MTKRLTGASFPSKEEARPKEEEIQAIRWPPDQDQVF
jgi:hypothetical protein